MLTIESNKLIAEFMGGLYNNQSRLSLQNNEIWLPNHGICNLDNNGKILKYHTSWDWLIECVKKIKSLVCESEFNYRIGKHLLNLNIEGVYNGCVDFIKWYNTQ